MVGGEDRRSAQRRREHLAYWISALIGVLQFGVPRIWLDSSQFKSEIGDYAGYVCIWWLNIILLMPTAARYLRGRWVTFMGVRKQLGIGVGFFICAHGLFSHVLGSGSQLDALNPGDAGSGFINFFLTIVLLITSIDRVRLSMSRKWWELHQRVGTFGITFLGTTASFGSKHTLVALGSQWFTWAVFAIRLAQLIHDRARVRRSHFVLNLIGFLWLLSYLALCNYVGHFYLLSTIYLGQLLMLVIVFLIRRQRPEESEG